MPLNAKFFTRLQLLVATQNRKGWAKVASEIPSAVGAIHSPRVGQGSPPSLGGGSFSSHATDETENGLQPLKSPRLLFLIFRIPHWPFPGPRRPSLPEVA